MLENNEPRQAILDRVRKANGEASALEPASAAWERIPRNYDAAPHSQHTAVAVLIDRLRDYEADVEQLTRAEIPQKVRAILDACAVEQVLLPEGIAPQLREALTKAQIDRGFSAPELDSFSCVITEATLGIAETGTLVLQNIPGQGRRAVSLVPDVHICILRGADVVGTVPEAMRRLQTTCTLPTTFISGPSATADIEMTRIKGVHGPRFLHVLITE
jgi:L-lactate dehydrogenase complex protein LldG